MHPEKQLLGIRVNTELVLLEEKVTKLEQLIKQLTPIEEVVLGRAKLVRAEQPEKHVSPKVCNVDELVKVIVVKPVQPIKALVFMVVTALGMLMVIKPIQPEKQVSPIVANLDPVVGITEIKSVKSLQSLKALVPKEVVAFAKVKYLSLEQPLKQVSGTAASRESEEVQVNLTKEVQLIKQEVPKVVTELGRTKPLFVLVVD